MVGARTVLDVIVVGAVVGVGVVLWVSVVGALIALGYVLVAVSRSTAMRELRPGEDEADTKATPIVRTINAPTGAHGLNSFFRTVQRLCLRPILARGGGLEPPITGPEPAVLPITPPPNGFRVRLADRNHRDPLAATIFGHHRWSGASVPPDDR
jgi:hypothetical protein